MSSRRTNGPFQCAARGVADEPIGTPHRNAGDDRTRIHVESGSADGVPTHYANPAIETSIGVRELCGNLT
jgi:hypothetical protein